MSKIMVHSSSLFFAFRYALGRTTYAPSIVIDDIVENIKKISNTDLVRYIVEIDECKNFGMKVDEENWLELRKKLESELDLRKINY